MILALGACTAPGPGPGAAPAPSPSLPATSRAAAPVRSGDCDAGVSRDALPEWALAGFNYDGSGTPHVLGDRGDLMAITFQYPPVADPENGTKILWVSRLPVETASPLVIDAVRADGRTAHQELPNGAGPSSVTIPAAGCWELTLTWSGHTDTMRLRFT
ncbi:hypothetical protein Acy02nite_14770 [Actinoplanes cyaneus]|uniref:Uncharacterized protein n=1 Tax=Actinoplanes cyaneus TaxID=52696 RepID=A0A919IFV3_9ACTN|nr:hypothetical protein [Actinoplanes cyaneus]GID63596.1 hypothetical protein Acy02nite_14770 [Actinoplanes cyaneus]